MEVEVGVVVIPSRATRLITHQVTASSSLISEETTSFFISEGLLNIFYGKTKELGIKTSEQVRGLASLHNLHWDI